MAGFRIEIRIGAAAVDRAMADADIGEALRIVIADRNVARGVELVIIDTGVPGNSGLGIEIRETKRVIRPADVDRYALGAYICFDFGIGDGPRHRQRQSPICHRRFRHPGRGKETASRPLASTPAAISPPIPKRSERSPFPL